MRKLIFVILALMLSCEKEYPETETSTMQQYSIQAGQKDFKPSPLPRMFLGRGDSRFSGTALFDHTCLYDWGTDNDRLDYNKLAGVSLKLAAPKNHNAVMIAWRPLFLSGKIEVAPYFNYEGGKIHIGQTTLKLSPNQKFDFHITQKGPLWSVVMFSEDTNELVTASHTYNFTSKAQWSIDPYFGGENNEPGEFGGVATQDMYLWLGFERN